MFSCIFVGPLNWDFIQQEEEEFAVGEVGVGESRKGVRGCVRCGTTVGGWMSIKRV